MEHLSALDAAFWYADDPHAPLHIASVAVFDGPAPTIAEIRQVYRHKLHLVPRLRQRVRPAPLGLARPAWEDDTAFRLDDHVRARVVPTPGATGDLLDTVEDLLTPPLDPTGALWQAWLLTGLADGQWALVSKLHHCMVDGIAGIDVLGHLLDRHADDALPPAPHWRPHPPASPVAAAAEALRSDVRAGARMLGAARAVGRAPVAAARRSVHVVRGTGRYLRSGRSATASAALTGPLHAPRAYRVASFALRDLQSVRVGLSGSVNDVVLAMATTAVRSLLLADNASPELEQVRCLVPVSVRPDHTAAAAGNRVSALLVDLPVEFADPVTRYRALVARTRDAKASHEADAGVALAGAFDYVPPALLEAGLHAGVHIPQHIVTTVVTNVPGPAEERYLLGRRMVANYPFVPVANTVRLGIAVTSYCHRIFVGITGDRTSSVDVESVRRGMAGALDELVDAAARARA